MTLQESKQFLFHFPVKCSTLAKLLALHMVLPFFLPVIGDGRGRALQASWDSIQALNFSSIIQRREQQDQHFQQAAFQAFDHQKTGRVYDVSSIGTASLVQAIRLRRGSLKKRGIVLNEFTIFPGCRILSSVRRVLLVYENLGKSDLFSVEGYKLVGPVVGVFAYDASDLSTTQALPKLSVVATESNISVRIPLFQSSLNVRPFCAYFQKDNLEVLMSNLTSSGLCETTHLGFISLIAESLSSAPSPAPAFLFPPLGLSPHGLAIRSGKSSLKAWKIVVGVVAGAVALVALLGVSGFVAIAYSNKQRLAVMERYADYGETLQTSLIRNTRTPAAGFTRTQPTLESEYVA